MNKKKKKQFEYCTEAMKHVQFSSWLWLPRKFWLSSCRGTNACICPWCRRYFCIACGLLPPTWHSSRRRPHCGKIFCNSLWRSHWMHTETCPRTPIWHNCCCYLEQHPCMLSCSWTSWIANCHRSQDPCRRSFGTWRPCLQPPLRPCYQISLICMPFCSISWHTYRP